jgi:hypothetical protein
MKPSGKYEYEVGISQNDIFAYLPIGQKRPSWGPRGPVTNKGIHIYGYIQLAPLPSYHLKGKNVILLRLIFLIQD